MEINKKNENLIRGLLNFHNIRYDESKYGERYHSKYWTVCLNEKSVSFKNTAAIFILDLNLIKIKINRDILIIFTKGDQKLEIEIIKNE